jgi:uncharacterized protein YndB with AHSA1/START domain
MPQPTGRVTRAAGGAIELVLTRTFDAPAADVWANLTQPELTAAWLGPWRGESGAGNTIELQMAFEEGDEWSKARIDECDPPRLIRVTTLNDSGDWPLEARLSESDGRTTLEFVHHLTDAGGAEFIGPGWEYYLDNLVAARKGQPPPAFADYYPAQAEHYKEQADRAVPPA